MKYKEWYLKYEAGISKEDFERFLDFLYRKGYDSWTHFGGNIACYENFKNQKYLRSSVKMKGLKKKFCIDNNPQHIKNQIFLKDILKEQIIYEIY